ncbi:EAL domain-containing protein [Frigidibacter oleivorans]|uniref:EAL domain-containing protein n=1 Tax=Frigidibacter oleivorans TaxID=2487129 RepID=UPI000F8F7997
MPAPPRSRAEVARIFRGPGAAAPSAAAIAGDPASPLDHAVRLRDDDVIAMVAAALDRQDAVLAFQPVVQAARPATIAYHEALIRLMDETGRTIPARDFMATVETTELGRRLDCLALDMGLAALAEAPGLRLSVNMSARSIGYRPWAQLLERGLDTDLTVAERLILEISEVSAMLLPDLVRAFMQAQQGRGVAFALDDFGAGAVSFRHLREFWFDLVKIDGQFIRGIAGSPDNQVLTEALLSVARQFDMFTVAEAVESAEDAAMLQKMGFDCLQGYYFGAPTIQPPWRMPPPRQAARGA